MTAGFIYVLVNSSMPGLLKVGKTTRTTAERCQELTSVTGVPTPFVVAFEQHFKDCHAAEQAIHAVLSAKGLRQAENREFFRGSSNEIIRLIMEIPDVLPPANEESVAETAAWEGVFAEARAFEQGSGRTFADAGKAERLYLLSARLGAPQGYQMAGRVAALKSEPDVRHVKNIFKMGAEHGDYECYFWMASLLEKSNPTDALKAWRLYFQDRRNSFDERFEGPILFETKCAYYIKFCVTQGVSPCLMSQLRSDRAFRLNVYDEVFSFAEPVAGSSCADAHSRSWLAARVWMEREVLIEGEVYRDQRAPAVADIRQHSGFFGRIAKAIRF